MASHPFSVFLLTECMMAFPSAFASKHQSFVVRFTSLSVRIGVETSAKTETRSMVIAST